ncbi:hypothetical protein [Govanella unica]|uniref:Uncharacterized protein n=1 Tax=Govanella unica TaxID=2975056 RepID=A0A9X3TWD3_9PROT|nr:hypothetical protein [Govania unica]MDA5192667.1 hypothetical protein [Govania unica]
MRPPLIPILRLTMASASRRAPDRQKSLRSQKLTRKAATDENASAGQRTYIGNIASDDTQPANRKRCYTLRRSSSIDYAQAVNILEAACHADAIGLPLNRFTTIHWEAGGVTEDFQGATGAFLKRAKDWLRLRGVEMAYVWVREDGPAAGEHVHILLHLPPRLVRDFSYRQRGWLKACGATFRKGVIFSRPVGTSLSHAFVRIRYGQNYYDHLTQVVDYMLKGADQVTRAHLGLSKATQTGSLQGKRTATSQNIGRAARNGVKESDLRCGTSMPPPVPTEFQCRSVTSCHASFAPPSRVLTALHGRACARHGVCSRD